MAAKSFVLFSASVFSSIRLIGLKAAAKGFLSEGVLTSLANNVGEVTVADTLGRFDPCGLSLLGPVGVNVLAAGLGLNSIALTFNRVEADDEGLTRPVSCTWLAPGGGMRRSLNATGGIWGAIVPVRYPAWLPADL